MKSLFENYWNRYSSKSLLERRKYFDSLSYREQQKLTNSFFEDRWDEYVAKNFLDRAIDYIRKTYGIDLLELRLKVIYNNKESLLIEKRKWNKIVDLINTFSDYYNTQVIFGDLLVESYNEQFYTISKTANRRIYGPKIKEN